MKHAIVILLAAVFAACVPMHGSQTPHTSDAADLERKTVALVMADGEGGSRAYCSGVWVAEDRILTANHCVDDSEIGDAIAYVTRGDVSASDADELEAVRVGRVSARDESHDLALIFAKLPPSHATAVVGASVSVGDVVQTMGHPRGLWWSYSAGNVAAIRLADMGYPMMWWVQSTAPISPGNSGGGLFDMSGDLVGIAHSYIPTRAENVNFYVHATYVRAFLDAAL
jgi:S1-C subfamily serine protease